MKVSCHIDIFCLMLVIMKILFLTVSFVMCYSFTTNILMPIMRHILWCRKTSTLFRRDTQRSHILHIHRNSRVGMASKLGRFMRVSTLVYDKNLCREPILHCMLQDMRQCRNHIGYSSTCKPQIA